MTDLKEDAQALFDAGRKAHEPSASDQERVLRGVLARGALAASLTSVSVGSAAAKGALFAVKMTAVTKIFLGLALLGVAGAGAYRVTTSRHVEVVTPAARTPAKQGADEAQRARSAKLPAPPQVVETISEPELPAVAPAAKRSDPVPRGAPLASPSLPESQPAPIATQDFPASPPASTSTAAASGVTLSREARALADVQRALREGRSAEALALLERQSQQFQAGALGQEREAARVVALCAAGRVAEAHVAAERFLAANPSSPVAARIRSSCAFP